MSGLFLSTRSRPAPLRVFALQLIQQPAEVFQLLARKTMALYQGPYERRGRSIAEVIDEVSQAMAEQTLAGYDWTEHVSESALVREGASGVI